MAFMKAFTNAGGGGAEFDFLSLVTDTRTFNKSTTLQIPTSAQADKVMVTLRTDTNHIYRLTNVNPTTGETGATPWRSDDGSAWYDNSSGGFSWTITNNSISLGDYWSSTTSCYTGWVYTLAQ